MRDYPRWMQPPVTGRCLVTRDPPTDEPIVGDIWSLVSEDTDICRVMYLYKHIRSGIAVFGG